MNKELAICERVLRLNQRQRDAYSNGAVDACRQIIKAIRDLPADPVPDGDLAKLVAETPRTTAMNAQLWGCSVLEVRDMENDLARLMAENERHEELFEQIDKWAEAYPTDLWPEVAKEDWKRIGQALDDNGLPSLDRISASNMRHVITRIKEQADKARAALKGEQK